MLNPVRIVILFACFMLWTFLARSSVAQDLPRSALEFSTGWAGFVDNATIHHAVFGGAARYYLTPRISVGPEFSYLVGPDDDRDLIRDLILTGNLIFDVLRPIDNRPRRITPYLLAGGGYFQHRNVFSGRKFTASEGAFTAGGGVRLFLTRSFYIAPEWRLGWELHQRLTITIGMLLR
jgi:Outer membrane protein beta-barrel domain